MGCQDLILKVMRVTTKALKPAEMSMGNCSTCAFIQKIIRSAAFSDGGDGGLGKVYDHNYKNICPFKNMFIYQAYMHVQMLCPLTYKAVWRSGVCSLQRRRSRPRIPVLHLVIFGKWLGMCLIELILPNTHTISFPVSSNLG